MLDPSTLDAKPGETVADTLLRLVTAYWMKEKLIADQAHKNKTEGVIELYKRGRADSLYELLTLVMVLVPKLNAVNGGSLGDKTLN